MEACNVCCEKYNKKNRKKIVCCACEYAQCQECVKTYLLQLQQIEPKCMNCNVEWNINFIKNNLPKNFLEKEYKKKQKDVIFEKEKQHFPTLMNEMHEEKERQKLLDESGSLLEKIRKQIQVKRKLRLEIRFTKYKEIKEEIECPNCYYQQITRINKKQLNCQRCKGMILRQITELTDSEKKRIDELEKKVEQCQEKMEEFIDKENKISKKIDKLANRKNKQVYYIHCPKNDCNGLVNNEKNLCDICDTKICKKCNEAIGQGHNCKQENIESAKKIRSQCKQCPICKAQIYRIEGCNDMFCVQCKTSFNWKTGQKIQRTTNPHYYEYVRQNHNIQDIGNQIDTEVCQNNLINIRLLTIFLEKKHIPSCTQCVVEVADKEITITREYLFDSEKKKIIDIHQKINHIESIEIRKLEENNINNRHKINDLCKQYLKNLLSEENLKDKLQKNRKQQEKKRNIQQILEAYVEVSKKEVNEILQQRRIEDIIRKVEIIENFRIYIQEQIEQAKNDYNSKMTIVI